LGILRRAFHSIGRAATRRIERKSVKNNLAAAARKQYGCADDAAGSYRKRGRPASLGLR
jgi:hypothetical protein